jgi:AraC-like DNA-binding protein
MSHHVACSPPKRTAAEIDENVLDSQNPRDISSAIQIEARRCWGPFNLVFIKREPGEIFWRRNTDYRITYFLNEFRAKLQEDDDPEQEYHILGDSFGFRPPGKMWRSSLTAGRYIQLRQNRDLYDQLAAEFGRGGVIRFEPRYNLKDPLISNLVLTAANEIKDGFLDRIFADALNTALAVRLVRLCGGPIALLEPSNGLSHERLGRVRDYIEDNLDSPLTLNEIAAVACLSPYHFSRSFKQTTGLTPHRYVMQQRVARAKALICRTHRPLAVIAQEVGFTDQSHLTSVFRREMGLTPGHLRAVLA